MAVVKESLNKSGRMGLGDKKASERNLILQKETHGWEKKKKKTDHTTKPEWLEWRGYPTFDTGLSLKSVLGLDPQIYMHSKNGEKIGYKSCKMLFPQKALTHWEIGTLLWKSSNYTGQSERGVSLPQRTAHLCQHQCFEWPEEAIQTSSNSVWGENGSTQRETDISLSGKAAMMECG